MSPDSTPVPLGILVHLLRLKIQNSQLLACKCPQNWPWDLHMNQSSTPRPGTFKMARTGVVLLKMGSLDQHCPHHQELGGEVKTQAHLGLAESGTPGIEGEIAHVHGLYGYTDKLSVLPALLCGLNTIPLKIPQSWFVIVKK